MCWQSIYTLTPLCNTSQTLAFPTPSCCYSFGLYPRPVSLLGAECSITPVELSSPSCIFMIGYVVQLGMRLVRHLGLLVETHTQTPATTSRTLAPSLPCLIYLITTPRLFSKYRKFPNCVFIVTHSDVSSGATVRN